MTRRCVRCESELSALLRSGTRWCSTKCRALDRAPRIVFPVAMKLRDRWVRRADDKRPLTTVGRNASIIVPWDWCSYAQASRSGVGVGLGFVLNGDGISCVDVDHCLVDGKLTYQAEELLKLCPGTFTSISQSGTGIHIFGKGTLKGGRNTSINGQSVEAYADGRYIAVTGRQLVPGSTTRLADIQSLLDLVDSH